jgi:TonB family protein
MPTAEITCIRCGHAGLPEPEGTCPRCGASVNLFQAAPLPRPAVVLPETDPDKLVKRGAAVPVLAAAAVVALALAGGGAWFTSRRGAARTGTLTGAAFPVSAPLASPDPAPFAAGSLPVVAAAPAPLRPSIAVASPEDGAASPEPARIAAAATEPRRVPDRPAAIDPPGQRPAPHQPGPRRTELEMGSASTVDPARPAAPERPASFRPVAIPGPGPVPFPSAAAPALSPAAGGAVPLPPPPRSTELVEDAPRFAVEGFQKPRMAEPGCVQAAVRLPRELVARLAGPVTVKFAVGTDGTVGLFEVVGQVPDRRVADALRSAIQSCRFLPGADAQGRKTRLWVVMPIRFER